MRFVDIKQLRVVRFFVCAILSYALLSICPVSAFADTRETDTIGNRTIIQSASIATENPSISANYAYVVDSDGLVYFQRDAYTRTNIASITKIMTAAVALKHADPNMKITVSAYAASVKESTACLWEGDIVTLEDALVGLMIPSGNDAATAIAEGVGQIILDKALLESTSQSADNKTSESSSSASSAEVSPSLIRTDGSVIDKDDEKAAYDAFVVEMNLLAKEIGCTDTLFSNPHGLDIGRFVGEMYSNAHDVAVMAAYAMQNPLFADIVSRGDTTITVDRYGQTVTTPLASTDLLLENYKGACGVKTGYTETAGSCFAGACKRDDKYIYAVVLDSEDNDKRFSDTRTLFNWVYNSQHNVKIANTSETTPMTKSSRTEDVPLIADAAHADWPDVTFPVSLENPEASVFISSIFGNISQNLVLDDTGGEISVGDVVGRIDIYQHNEIVASEKLIACEDVQGPNILEYISLFWKRITGEITDDSKAKTVIYNEMPILVQKS